MLQLLRAPPAARPAVKDAFGFSVKSVMDSLYPSTYTDTTELAPPAAEDGPDLQPTKFKGTLRPTSLCLYHIRGLGPRGREPCKYGSSCGFAHTSIRTAQPVLGRSIDWSHLCISILHGKPCPDAASCDSNYGKTKKKKASAFE